MAKHFDIFLPLYHSLSVPWLDWSESIDENTAIDKYTYLHVHYMLKNKWQNILIQYFSLSLPPPSLSQYLGSIGVSQSMRTLQFSVRTQVTK